MKMIGVCFRKLNVYIFVYLTKVSLSFFLSLFLSFSLSFFLFLSLTHLFHLLLKARRYCFFFYHQRQEAQNNRSIASLAQFDEDFFVNAFYDTLSRT